MSSHRRCLSLSVPSAEEVHNYTRRGPQCVVALGYLEDIADDTAVVETQLIAAGVAQGENHLRSVDHHNLVRKLIRLLRQIMSNESFNSALQAYLKKILYENMGLIPSS